MFGTDTSEDMMRTSCTVRNVERDAQWREAWRWRRLCEQSVSGGATSADGELESTTQKESSVVDGRMINAEGYAQRPQYCDGCRNSTPRNCIPVVVRCRICNHGSKAMQPPSAQRSDTPILILGVARQHPHSEQGLHSKLDKSRRFCTAVC